MKVCTIRHYNNSTVSLYYISLQKPQVFALLRVTNVILNNIDYSWRNMWVSRKAILVFLLILLDPRTYCIVYTGRQNYESRKKSSHKKCSMSCANYVIRKGYESTLSNRFSKIEKYNLMRFTYISSLNNTNFQIREVSLQSKLRMIYLEGYS